MDRSVRDHINGLEQRLLTLNASLMDEDNPSERNRLESQLRAIQSAIVLFKSAIEAEQQISG